MINMKQNFNVILLGAILMFGNIASATEIESPVAMLKRTSDEVMVALNKQRSLLETEPDRLFDIVEKKGGALELVVEETSATNQMGELVGKSTQTLVIRHG